MESVLKTIAGKAVTYCYNLNNGVFRLQNQSNFFQVRTYAKRKGYREEAKKKKVKRVIEKQPWIPHNLRKKDITEKAVSKKIVENENIAVDDVWLAKSHAWRVFEFKEAIECHKETHHPTMYNDPDAMLNLFLELDMSTARPTRFVEKFKRMAILPNIFEQEGLGDRSILVFCKSSEQKEAAQAAGATLVGGTEIIKEIQRGKIVLPDFKFVIADPSILPEMVTIRGLLKRKFPNVSSGTLGPNIGELVTQFKNGVEYSCLRDEVDPSFGWIETSIGRLNMDVEKLEENLTSLIENINKNRPKRPGPFVTRILMLSPPSPERLKINAQPYLQEEEDLDAGSSSDEDEAVKTKI